MAAARLKGSLAGDKAQRDTAYDELAALADGGKPPADAMTGLTNATLHIGGLEEEAAKDEAKLAERLSTFGTVLAITLRREVGKPPWALVTYAEAAESERALAGAAELGAESVVVRRLDTQQALGSDGAMDEMIREQRRRVEVRVAASCVGPLVEAVLCADASEVDAEEYQRASALLGSLCWMDRDVSAEYFRNGHVSATWTASGNALNAVAAKDPAQLTRDDALTIASDAAVVAVYHAQAIAGLLARPEVDLDQVTLLGTVSTQYPLMPGRVPIEEVDYPRQMILLLLEICRDPQGACAEAVAGAWMQ